MKKVLSFILAICMVFGFVSSPYIKSANALDLDIDSSEETDTSLAVEHENFDGTEYEWSDHVAQNAYYYYDTSKGSYVATVDFNDTVYSFSGWYINGELISKNINYAFDITTTNLSELTAKFATRNVLVGGAGFEGYDDGANLRVDPPESGVAPHDDKWGVYCIYAKNSNTSAGYEQPDWGFTITAVKGGYTDEYVDSYYYDETGATVRNYKEHTIYPYDGNTMLKLSIPSRSAVRKIEGLKPNTNYTFEFYAYTPDPWDYIRTVTVANTYDLESYATTAKSPKVVYGSYSEPSKKYDDTTYGLSNTDRVRNWTPYSVTFITGDATEEDGTVDAYVHISISSKNGSGSKCEFMLDNMTCVENIIANAGNSIRANTSDYPQALRYKFFMNNDNMASYNGMPTKKVGVLVAATNWLGNKNLVVDGEYSYGGKTVKPINKTLKDSNKQYVDGDVDNTYFTAALYNIGSKLSVDSQTGEAVVISTNYDMYGSNYSVRPYIVYSNSQTGQDVIVYGETVDVSVFDVMLAVKHAGKIESDMDTIDQVLEDDNVYNAFQKWQPASEWMLRRSNVTDFDYSMAVVGDIQMTTEYYPDELHYMYDWIVENKENKNISHAFNLGDLTNNNAAVEWATAEEQFKRVKEAGVSLSLIRGNHDWGYDSYITYSEYGEGCVSFDGTMKSYYMLKEIGGVKYMMLTLELFAPDNVIEWAKNAVDSHPDYNVIVSTHAYISANEKGVYLGKEDTIKWGYEKDPARNCGQEIFDKLISKCSNIVLVLCGHDPAVDHSIGRIDATREDGSKVVQLMIDHQDMESFNKKSYNMLAMFYFSENGRKVQVEYFSTISGLYYMDKNQFTFELDLVD